MKYLWLTIICIAAFIFPQKKANAQTPPPPYVPNVIPPSPEAAALMKFVDVPVSPYTGTADISVPIYTIHAKGMDIPISLSYHTGGIRLDEEASWVGLGWALNAGGMISRTINDKDDLNGMYFNQPVPQLQGDISDHQPARCATPQNAGFKYIVNFFESYNVNFLTGPGNTETAGDFTQPFGTVGPNQPFDLEPDSYSYNVLGMSGKFIIKRDKTIVLEKQDNTKIQIVNNGGGDPTFIITDDKGNKYYFDQTQAVLPASASGGTPSSWFLSKIVTQQNEQITFTYGGSGFVTTPTLKTQSYRPYLSFGNQYTESSNTGTQYNNVNLQNITYNGGQVTFGSDNVRNDLSGAYKLNTIGIYARNTGGLTLLKSHNLYYSYFVALGAQGGTTEANRLRLDSIQEVSGSQTIKPYVFTYNFNSQASGVLLAKRSYNMDHWGFFNGSPNSVLIPSTSVYYNNGVDAPGQVSYSGANREASFPFTQTFSLQKITYPTGGSTIMEYEANDYNYRRSLQAGQEFLPQTKVTIDTSIYLSSATSGTIDVSKIWPTIEPTVQGYNFHINVTFRASNNGSGWSQQDINTFNKLGVIVHNDQTDLSSAPCSGTPCIVRSRTYDLAISQVASRTPIPWSFYYDPSAIPPADIGDVILRFSYDVLKSTPQTDPVLPAGGIRTKSVTEYLADGTMAKKRSWNYHYGTNNELTNGLLMSFPSYVREEITHVDNGGVAGEFLLHQVVMFGTTNTPLTSGTSGNVVGYSQVTETTVDPSNSSDNGKVVYNYYNVPDSVIAYNKLRFPGMNNVRHSLNGSLLSQITYRKVGNAYAKVKETNNFYHTVNRKAYYSAKYQGSQLNNPSGSCSPTIPGVPNAGFAEFYPSIISEKVLQDSTREISYDNDTTKYVINSNKMFYDNPVHYQLTRQITTDSKGNKHVSKVTYPQDYAVSGGLTNNTILDALISRNMLSESIEKRDSIYYRGVATGLVDAASFTKYKQLSTETMVPDKMYKLDIVKPVVDFQAMSVSGNTVSQDSRYRQLIGFDGYDHLGNPTQYTVTGQLPVSIIWDYKSVSPIALVNNADSVSVAYTSFEADGTGHWTVASPSRVTTASITGKNSYSLTNGSISKSGLTAANSYIVSYWTTNTSPLSITGTMSGYPVKGGTNKGWTYYEHQVTGVTTVTVSGTANIDEVRLYPAGARMTSYTYDPLVGVTSSTDAKNQVSYYEYDGFQRLRDVRDQDGNIVKHMDYHYQGQ